MSRQTKPCKGGSWRALASARDIATLASQRYQQGLSSYLELVDTERAVYTILLAMALGGGRRRPDAAHPVNSK